MFLRSRFNFAANFPSAGRFNFYCVAGGLFSQVLYCGVRQHHNFTAPGHGGGPVDNAGKVARNYMNSRSKYLQEDLAHNYASAYQTCSKGMTEPSKHNTDKGTWGCNGVYIWKALSNGFDKGGRADFPHVPVFDGDVTAVAGSQNLFGFKNVCTALCLYFSCIIITRYICLFMHAGH